MNQNPQAPSSQSTDIFINYRRSDTSGHAGRLEQQLSQRFPGRIFMDIHNIEAGRDFTEVIAEEVGKCGVLIVMIGNQWVDITDPETGKRRLDDPTDFVAAEIAGALQRNIRIIPVLVEGAKMPRQEELPAALAGLVRRNAIELSDTRWDYDVDQLIKVLEKICGSPSVATAEKADVSPAGKTSAGKWGTRKIAMVAAAPILLAVVFLVIYLSARKDSAQPQAGTALSSLSQPQGTNNAANSAEAKPLTMQAVVTLPESEADSKAEFVFPFDTTGSDWEWFQKQSKPNVDEYHWDVFIGDPDNEAADHFDYKITVWVAKAEGYQGEMPVVGNFASLIDDAAWGVTTRRGTDRDWSTPELWKDADIHPVEQSDGLRIVVKGAGVKRIFGSRPEKVTFLVLNPKTQHPKQQEKQFTLKVVYP
jgi:hypothetical protein